MLWLLKCNTVTVTDTTDIGDEDEVSIEELEARYTDKQEENIGNKCCKEGRRRKRILRRSKKKDNYQFFDKTE